MGRSGHAEREERRQAALALLAEGQMLKKDIAKKLGITRQTLNRWEKAAQKSGSMPDKRSATDRGAAEIIIETYDDIPPGGWSFLPWEQAKAWVKALNDGGTMEMAADMCGVERDEPGKWERWAEDEHDGSDLGNEARSWRRVTRKRMTQLRLALMRKLVTSSYGHEVSGAKALEQILSGRGDLESASRSVADELGALIEQASTHEACEEVEVEQLSLIQGGE